MEGERGLQGAHPVVVDGLAVHELNPPIAQTRHSRRVRPERRVHRVFNNDDSVTGFAKTDSGMRHTHVSLVSSEHSRAAPG